MNIPRSFLSVAIAAAFSATLLAQQAPSGFHGVACIKIQPGKSAEFHKWMATDGHAFQQARVDSGAITTWFLLHSVIPQGTSAECDYLSIALYPGAPPKPGGLDEIDALLKKAGLTMSAQEFVDHRSSLTELVSNDLFQNQISVGTMKKGDYFMVNYMKVSDIGDWLKLEKEVWQPMAESMVKAGVNSGWSVNELDLAGRRQPAVSGCNCGNVYPSWDAVFTGKVSCQRALPEGPSRHGIRHNHGTNRQCAHHCVEEAVHGCRHGRAKKKERQCQSQSGCGPWVRPRTSRTGSPGE